MIVGVHDFVDALGRFKDETVSTDGGLSLIAMDGLLLIPLIMAAFFYPVIALGTAAALVAVSFAGMMLMRAHRKGQVQQPGRSKIKG